ncbi:MAG: phosphoribosylglycinamide formyltransferase [Planktomarina sp.]|uniref:phosphoribosylglycinamide formyltransferase n=1 Tax=Planktomarina sp. TaxID=2024851 RepID=UPI002890317B|nr:phosphoribosylglycinamide formyltransferase [Planktomarina sp.]MDT2031381.1 phosphoribosylglycinamide formyltransferase [Planktomarina sp.]
MLNVAILISGGGSNMLRLLEDMALPHPGHACLVLSNRPEAGVQAKAQAQAMGVAVEVLDHRPFGDDRASFETELHKILKAYEIDVICLAGFMRILGAEFVSAWQGRMLNIHPSLLPKYQGLHTHQRALEAGDRLAGCSVHEVVPQLDAGPILGQSEVPILPGDTAQDLADRVLMQEHLLYPKILRAFLTRFEPPS